MSRRRKIYFALTIVIVLLVVIRITLPFIILHFANKSLATMKGYYGRIKDVDIALIKGAYKIDSIYLNKVDSVSLKQSPFFYAAVISLSIEWKALFNGSLVGDVVFERPVVIFTKDKVEPTMLQNDSTDFKKVFDDFMPLRVNRLEVNNGSIRYKDEGSKPLVDIAMNNTYILAENLRNSYDSSTQLPAIITASADIYGGTLALHMKLNPLAELPTFDMNSELKKTNLIALNDFFQAYSKIDVNKGTFGMYVEAAAKGGKFIGYVKPLIKDIDILGKEDRGDNVFRKLWEGLIGGVAQIIENRKTDKIATKILFEGELKHADTNVWFAITTILRNAFIQALQPSIDNEINLGSVDSTKSDKRNLLQRIFKKDDKNERKE